MVLSKTEINLRRLLAAAPNQRNPSKLMHFVATLREQLEQLETEATSEGATRISKAKLNDYSEKIEALATSFATELVPPPDVVEVTKGVSNEETPKKEQEYKESNFPGLRRRHGPQMRDEGKTGEITETQQSPPVTLDHSAHVHIDKHRKLQEDLTDEMVVLARQLKETSLIMSQSVKNTEKVLDSTENAVEHSLASTGRANVRAAEIYSQSVKTSCFTWLLMFFMICVFVMVVLLIRIT